MPKVYECAVEMDEFTHAASVAFDYVFDGNSKFVGWEKPNIPKDFKIGLIVGPSGSGKSIMLSEFGKEESLNWLSNKAIVSHFSSPQEAIKRLTSVGLNTIPSWCKPYHVLSNGEKFRADLAMKIKDGAIIDEFTSVVDRNVAKSASSSLRKFIDNEGIKNVVVASCHSDIIEWLRPDWYFDTATGTLTTGRFLRRPPIRIQIYRCQRSVWRMFAKHHYLSDKLNPTCRAFLATANLGEEETVVGFVSSITMPSGFLKKAWREHRTVVLPDFQGLGIGPAISDMVADIHLREGKRYFSRTAHPRFGAYRDRSLLWKKTSKYKKIRKDTKVRKEKNVGQEWSNSKNYVFDDTRDCYSHEYIGKAA